MKQWLGGIWMAVLVAAAVPAVQAQHVGRVADGTWKGPWVYSGNVVSYNDRNTWLDIWVHNLGYNKEVGMVWTDNGWQTANWTKGVYELTWADGAERWGVDLIPAGQFMWHRSSAHGWVDRAGNVQIIGSNGKAIEYAIYYLDKHTGRMYWDNNHGRNYSIWVVKSGPNGYVE